MVADEFDVADEAAEIFPSRELAGVNYDALQAAMRFNPRVGRKSQSIEILGAQSVLYLDDDGSR